METPEVHAHAHHGSSGHRWFDITAAVCAMVVSLISLYLAIHHGRVMQQMAEANARMVTATSWPSVSFSSSNMDPQSQQPALRLTLSNRGIGPARIQGMELQYEGQPVADINALLKACCRLPQDGEGHGASWAISTANGEILRPGEDRSFVRFRHEGSNLARWEQLEQLTQKVRVKVCYCSVFDECWVARSDQRLPERVQACPADWQQYQG